MRATVTGRVWRYPTDMEIFKWCEKARLAGLPKEAPWPFVIWGEVTGPVWVRDRGLRKKVDWEEVASGKVAKVLDETGNKWFCLESQLVPIE